MRITTIVLALCAAAAPAQTRPSPEAVYQQSVRDADRVEGRGEDFCWHAGYHMDRFRRGWLASRDSAWVEWGVKYFDHLLGEMLTGPDGYRGWIGPYEYVKTYWQDSHVGDALLAGGSLRLAETILAEPSLKGKFGEAARRYVAVARRDVLEKWDHRGTYHRDGALGAYVCWDWFADPGNRNWRQIKGVDRAGLSHPFNKQNDLGLVALRLWRITGEKPYRDKAEQLFSYARSRFRLVNGSWRWNYWEPFGPWDLNPEKGTTVHWVGVHPYRNYQAREVEQIVEAYHSGIVFSRQDMERIARTNLEVMWNQDRANPKFVNSDNDLPGGAEKRARLKPPKGEGLAGTLWTSLADFNQTVRDLLRPARDEDSRAVREAEILKRPVGFDRRYAKEPVALPSFPDTGESKELNMAAIIGGKWLVSNSLAPGDLEVALHSGDGAKKIKTLCKSARGMLIWRWDDPPAAPYRVRWSTGGGYREVVVP